MPMNTVPPLRAQLTDLIEAIRLYVALPRPASQLDSEVDHPGLEDWDPSRPVAMRIEVLFRLLLHPADLAQLTQQDWAAVELIALRDSDSSVRGVALLTLLHSHTVPKQSELHQFSTHCAERGIERVLEIIDIIREGKLALAECRSSLSRIDEMLRGT